MMDKNYLQKIASIVILAILITLSFLLLKPILMSIITAIILAFIFHPLYEKTLKHVKSRNLSTIIISAILIILIVIPLWLLTPILLEQSIEIFMQSQKMDFVTPLKQIVPQLFESEQFSNEIGSVIYSFVTNLANSVMNMISKLIINFPTLFLQFLVVFFTFFFVLRDNDKFVKYIQSLLPFPKKTEERLFKSSRDITMSILYGQVIIGILQGLFAGVSFFLFGVENALFLTILACLAGIFPILGTAIIWVPVSIFVLMDGAIWPAIGIIFFGIIAAFVENGVKPMIVSKRTNVHSAVIMLGMIGGLFFFGILGFILGPLILAYLLIVLELYRDKRTPGVFIRHPEDEDNEEINIKTNFF